MAGVPMSEMGQSRRFDRGSAIPVYTEERTSSDRFGMSEKCQKRTSDNTAVRSTNQGVDALGNAIRPPDTWIQSDGRDRACVSLEFIQPRLGKVYAAPAKASRLYKLRPNVFERSVARLASF